MCFTIFGITYELSKKYFYKNTNNKLCYYKSIHLMKTRLPITTKSNKQSVIKNLSQPEDQLIFWVVKMYFS